MCYNIKDTKTKGEKIMNKDNQTVISVKNVTKKFNVYFDKTNTIKENCCFGIGQKTKKKEQF